MKILLNKLASVITIFAVLFFFTPFRVHAGNTYATFDPSNKHANIVLSNGNLTAANNTDQVQAPVRTTIGPTSGKWYWEAHVDVVGATVSARYVGTVDPSFNTATAQGLGNSAKGLAAQSVAGTFSFCNNVLNKDSGGFVVNDYVGIAMDLDNDTIDVYVNNVQKFQCTGVTGVQYGAVNVYDLSDKFTANFGATALHYTPPSGYNAGLYTADTFCLFCFWDF